MSPTAHPTTDRQLPVVVYATAYYLCFLAVFGYTIGDGRVPRRLPVRAGDVERHLRT